MATPKLEKIPDTAYLYDCYGVLLTEKQALALRLFYDEDFSLSEIAAEMGGSRQSVHELVRRAEELLQYYEQRLGLSAAKKRRQELLTKLQEMCAETVDEGGMKKLLPLFTQMEDQL
ncbi:MAG: sigma factor-like helix-turn-helix DNA-binding protein [Clostridiales bacterium]